MPHAWRSELSSLSCPLRHTGVARTHGNAKSGARGGENRTQHGKFDCIPIPHPHADLPPIFWPSCREQTRPKIFMSVLFVVMVMCDLTSNGGTGGGAAAPAGNRACPTNIASQLPSRPPVHRRAAPSERSRRFRGVHLRFGCSSRMV